MLRALSDQVFAAPPEERDEFAPLHLIELHAITRELSEHDRISNWLG